MKHETAFVVFWIYKGLHSVFETNYSSFIQELRQLSYIV